MSTVRKDVPDVRKDNFNLLYLCCNGIDFKVTQYKCSRCFFGVDDVKRLVNRDVLFCLKSICCLLVVKIVLIFLEASNIQNLHQDTNFPSILHEELQQNGLAMKIEFFTKDETTKNE